MGCLFYYRRGSSLPGTRGSSICCPPSILLRFVCFSLFLPFHPSHPHSLLLSLSLSLSLSPSLPLSLSPSLPFPFSRKIQKPPLTWNGALFHITNLRIIILASNRQQAFALPLKVVKGGEGKDSWFSRKSQIVFETSTSNYLFILFYFILFYFILFYFILFYFILFYFILFYFILFYFILFYFILFYFILFYFILFYFILFYFILFYFILFYFILFYFILFYFIFYFFFFVFFLANKISNLKKDEIAITFENKKIRDSLLSALLKVWSPSFLPFLFFFPFSFSPFFLPFSSLPFLTFFF